jgi:proteasome lid subunit RPN8/RPN11
MAPNLAETVSRDEVIEAVYSSFVEIVEHANAYPEQEVVGAVMLDGYTVRLVNEAEDRTADFKVGPEQLAGLKSLVAIYHSHPEGQELPSVTDEMGQYPIPMVIVTPVVVVLWWYSEMTGYYRLWDAHYGVG